MNSEELDDKLKEQFGPDASLWDPRTNVRAFATAAHVSQTRSLRRRDEYMARRAHISMTIFWTLIAIIQFAIVVMVVLLAMA